MLKHLELRRDVYYDSVVLFQASSQLRELDGIDECLVAMATELNIRLLHDLGFKSEDTDDTSTSDLIIAVQGESQEIIGRAIQVLDSNLESQATPRSEPDSTQIHRSLGRAVRAANANLAIISLPGPHVAPEAADALREGTNVMIFSDGVSIKEEQKLKALATSHDLLVMGPDCGTAQLSGVGLGFCNDLSPGQVSIVAASGTGAQHLSCLLDANGIGISSIIGVGGRDMSDEIGGSSTLQALRILDSDTSTAHIALISKPPGKKTVRRINKIIKSLDTPVTIGLIGDPGVDLTKVAREIATTQNLPFRKPRLKLSGAPATGGQLIGLFSGGTLASEAAQIITDTAGPIAGIDTFEIPTPQAIADRKDNVILDLGDDRMTMGRPHPMIDGTLRCKIIKELTLKPAPRLLLFDIILGFGSNPDPAGEIANALDGFLRSHSKARAIASVVGTSRDPQGLDQQWQTLTALGCDVYESNAEAASAIALDLLTNNGKSESTHA
ncbi:MAG: FdrA family protein [Pseudomonadota bacterium]|nr:FdrA family protein [Pseudomonadota bacterium]